MLLRSIFIAIVCALLNACGGNPPSDRYEVALNGINGGTFSDNGQFAIVGSVLHGGSFWLVDQRERQFNWNHNKDELSIILSADIEPNNRWAVTAEAHTLVLWDTTTGQAARFWTAPGEVLDVELAVGGRYALLGQADHSAVVFNIMRGGIVRSFSHEGRVRSVGLSKDGRIAITGSEDQTAVIWRVDSGEKLMTMPHNEDVQLVAISPDGRFAFSAAKYDRAAIWDIEQKKLVRNIPLAKEKLKRGLRVTAARFSNDGKQLLLGYANKTVELWRVGADKPSSTWKLSSRKTWQPSGVAAIDLAFKANGRGMVAMGSNGFIYELSAQ